MDCWSLTGVAQLSAHSLLASCATNQHSFVSAELNSATVPNSQCLGSLACDVTTGDKLWDTLVEKKSARSRVSSDLYNVDPFYHPDEDRYGTNNNDGGHFATEDISLFDASFFSIAPAEAMAMDPMQRLLLEATYEALENSGTPLFRVMGSKTSCSRRDMELAPRYQSTSASQTMLSNRLSYFFDIKGPRITLDTACSSGLVTVHLACQNLRTGESSMAVVGGSNLILSPDIQIEMSDIHFLSPNSIFYAFYEQPLDLALRDNDPIRAVIRGTAASSSGRTSSLTMPSKGVQVHLIRSAYKAAGCAAASDLTGTGAIGEAFAAHRSPAANGAAIPLSTGSLKANIGHLRRASGIAGLIKAVLSVEKGTIAPNIWFRRVLTDTKDWPLEGWRRAGGNSFGY
ncbi:ketoacyl-synt-domain-containing protein [Pyrenochaeta sp. DS3sAY3a]|nr:ketoacyl-synt-domain-containing protein [Pyrenochaeta sp. DS3sAY3a]